MDMVCPNEGKARVLALIFGADSATPAGVFVKLYKNDYTPDDDSTDADFDGATFGGSDRITLDPVDWDAPVVVSDVGQIDSIDPPSWTCTSGGPETVYGWWMIDQATSAVLFAQRFDTPRVMSVGATEVLTPFRIKAKTFG